MRIWEKNQRGGKVVEGDNREGVVQLCKDAG